MSFQQQAMNTPLLPAAFAGFVGGDAAASAHTASYLYGRRNVPSLYNSPGSYKVAGFLRALAQSRFWDGLHGGISLDPEAFSRATPSPGGPKFVASFSGTTMTSTGEAARALLEHCQQLHIDAVAEGRVTTPFAVTVADLYHAPTSEARPTLKAAAPLLPILASAGAAAGCGLIGDWYTFSMIVFGMVCNAATSIALRSGDLVFTRPAPTPGSPAGDGFLESGNEVIVLKGSEDAVSAVTRGRFSLRYKNEQAVGRLSTCATLSTLQCLVQLAIVPQGTVFGQLLFLATIAVAWLYHSVMEPVEKKAKAKLIVEDLLEAPSTRRYSLGTRAAMAVFLMQVLKPTNIEEQLAALIPNNTRVWTVWRQVVARRLRDGKPSFDAAPPSAEVANFNDEEKKLLSTLLNDAQAAVSVYARARV